MHEKKIAVFEAYGSWQGGLANRDRARVYSPGKPIWHRGAPGNMTVASEYNHLSAGIFLEVLGSALRHAFIPQQLCLEKVLERGLCTPWVRVKHEAQALCVGDV